MATSSGWKALLPGQEDPLFTDIIHEITQHRIRSLDNFGLNIHVCPSKSARSAEPTSDRYIFEHANVQTSEMEVRADDDGLQILVAASGKEVLKKKRRGRHNTPVLSEEWMPLQAWLDTLPRPDDQFSSLPDLEREYRRYAHQSNWWQANGKAFRVLDLPSEIRDTIWTYAMGPVVEPFPHAKVRRGRLRVLSDLCPRPNSCLLHTSRQVSSEAGKMLYLQTPFYLEHFRLWIKLIENPVFPISHLRNLELSFSHNAYFSIFGCALSAFTINPDPTARILAHMTLRQLELRIPSPAKLVDSERWLKGGCHKTIVDWILEAAWPYIKDHPVQLAGYVKREQKAAFEAKLARRRRRMAAWRALGRAEGVEAEESGEESEGEEGGVVLEGDENDGEDTGSGVVRMRDAVVLPPICECKGLCTSFADWAAED